MVAAVLAAGNANDHQRVLRDRPLVEAVVAGDLRRIDLLRLTTGAGPAAQVRYAHSYIGLGLTPVVAIDLEKGGKGSFREIVAVVRTFARFRPFTIEVADGTRRKIDSLLFANIAEMAKYATLSEDGDPADGRFEVIELPHTSKWRLLGVALRAATRGLGRQPTATRLPLRHPQADTAAARRGAPHPRPRHPGLRRDRPRRADDGRMRSAGTAFVLGGGGVLGAVQVGMLRALLDGGVRPDLVVGTSVGAINGAVLAALPARRGGRPAGGAVAAPDAGALFAGGTVRRLRELTRTGVAAHSPDPLRRALTGLLGDRRIEDLPGALHLLRGEHRGRRRALVRPRAASSTRCWPPPPSPGSCRRWRSPAATTSTAGSSTASR